MIKVKGKRGKSKAAVELSLDTYMGSPVFHVWEGGKITHTFFVGDPAFMERMKACGCTGLNEHDRVSAIRKEAGLV